MEERPWKRKNLSGERFGRLIAIRDVGDSGWGGRVWECRCDCGGVIRIEAGNLQKPNRNRSCGCLWRKDGGSPEVQRRREMQRLYAARIKEMKASGIDPPRLKRPVAINEEERLQRRRETFKKWYMRVGPPEWTPERAKRGARLTAEYRKRHPERVKATKANRRARELAADGQHSSSDLKEIISAQKNKCGYCRKRLTKKDRHIDHIIALASGGTNDKRNLQFLCAHCNQRKSAKHPLIFARERGLLL